MSTTSNDRSCTPTRSFHPSVLLTNRPKRYNRLSGELLTRCPVNGCNRDFTTSKNGVRANGTDLSHYTLHLMEDRRCMEHQERSSLIGLHRNIRQLPASFRSRCARLVEGNRRMRTGRIRYAFQYAFYMLWLYSYHMVTLASLLLICHAYRLGSWPGSWRLSVPRSGSWHRQGFMEFFAGTNSTAASSTGTVAYVEGTHGSPWQFRIPPMPNFTGMFGGA